MATQEQMRWSCRLVAVAALRIGDRDRSEFETGAADAVSGIQDCKLRIDPQLRSGRTGRQDTGETFERLLECCRAEDVEHVRRNRCWLAAVWETRNVQRAVDRTCRK